MKRGAFFIGFATFLLLWSESYAQTPQDMTDSKGEINIESADKIEGKPKFTFELHGYLKLQALYDFNDLQNKAFFEVPSIQFNPKIEDYPSFRMDVNQSRIKLDATYMTDKVGPVRVYFETDFYNSKSPLGLRLRHAFIEAKGFLIGQWWSVATDRLAWPDVNDFDGPPIGGFVRPIVMRYKKEYKRWIFIVGIETARVDTDPAIYYVSDSLNVREVSATMPDIGTDVRYTWPGGYLFASAIYRQIPYKINNYYNKADGYGFSVSGKLVLNNYLPKVFQSGKDYFMFQGVYGKGYGRNQVSWGRSYDADFNGVDRVNTVPMYGYFVAINKYILKSDFHTCIVYCQSFRTNNGTIDTNNPVYFQIGNRFEQVSWFSANIFWDFLPNMQLGVEYLYGTRKTDLNNFGDANRMGLMAQFNF